MPLSVAEALATYERAMRNVLPGGEGVCRICHTFIDPAYAHCHACGAQPQAADVVVPITYSEHLGLVHTALRQYKDGPPQAQAFVRPRLAAILWRFLELHERCIASAAGIPERRFDIVTTVPSSTPSGDEARQGLRWIAGTACRPTASRFRRVLRATGDVSASREYDGRRYAATQPLDGLDTLLLDDTWARGGHAQSAAHALKRAGARRVAVVVIGRHIRPEWQVTGGSTSGALLAALPQRFAWDICPVHLVKDQRNSPASIMRIPHPLAAR